MTTVNSKMCYPGDQLSIDTETVIAIYELVQAAELVGSKDKNKDDPGIGLLVELGTDVQTRVRRKAKASSLNMYVEHLTYLKNAEISVKNKVRDEEIKGLRSNIKIAMTDAVKIFEQFEDNKVEAHAGKNGATVGMKRDRDTMLDAEIDEKLKEIESLRKRLRETK